MTARVVFKLVFGTLFIPALLVGISGNPAWVGAWVFSAIFAGYGLVSVLYFAKKDPSLLEKRMDTRLGPEPWDRAFIVISGIFMAGQFVCCALDERFGWSSVPGWVAAVAMALVLASLVITFLVMRENTFLARVVVKQEGQTVITTGPYAVVRHPMYAAFNVMLVAISLALDSPISLPFAVGSVAALIFRTAREDAFLHRELPGYPAYAQRTRWRLVPGLW